ncbi:hypothetical protein M3J09_001440 [Ascochyta lentis]
MRLLECVGTDTFQFTRDFRPEDEVPPYAILSHTWLEGEEVIYDDILEGRNTDRAGYEKIRFCGQQAQLDGLRYFWVDTCCVNKADRAELGVALSSMFRWYQNATRCCAYLSDVFISKRKVDIELDEAT